MVRISRSVVEALESFEDAWSGDGSPSIEEYLPTDVKIRLDALRELVMCELELRLKSGEQARVEPFFHRFPELQEDTDSALKVIEHEFIIRGRLEIGLNPQEYRDRFPHLHLPFASGGECPPSTAANLDLRLLEKRGEGGLGRVWAAYDARLDRTVAFKEIKPRLANIAESRSRFETEAKATAGLQHPGIVPIYNIGSYRDGRPFYTMKLIEGMSMTEAIATLHNETLSSQERQTSLRNLLRQLISVCNAVHYAHGKGVLHRDLKPQNIMIGENGEAYVVDWGLAKVAKQLDEDNTSNGAVVEGKSSTMVGNVLGSPAYMSPEQAAGQHSSCDERTDVYGLGATLYTLLTNEVPKAESQLDSKKLESPLRNAVVPSSNAIWSICRKAMSKDKADRYPSASQLATDIEHYLSYQQVRAHAESTSQKLLRMVRRYPGIVSALFAALLVTTVIVGASATAINRERAIAIRNELAEQDARLQAEGMLGLWTSVLKNSLPSLGGVNAKVIDLLDEVGQQLDDDSEYPVEVRYELLATIADTYSELGAVEQALKYRELAIENFPESLPNRDRLFHRERLAASILSSGDPARAASLLEVVLEEEAKLPKRDIKLRFSANRDLARSFVQMGKVDVGIEKLQATLREAEESDESDSIPTRQVIHAMGALADAQADAGQTGEAINQASQALKMAREILNPDDTVFCILYSVLGKAYNDSLDYAKSLEFAALTLSYCQEHLPSGSRNTLIAANNLGSAYSHVGLLDESEEHFRWVIEHDDGVDAASAMKLLGQLKIRQQDYTAAMQWLNKSSRLIAARSGDNSIEHLSVSKVIADCYLASGKWDEASESYRRIADGRAKALGPLHPHTINAKSKYAQSLIATNGAYQAINEFRTLARLVTDDRVRGTGVVASLTLQLAMLETAVGNFQAAHEILTREANRCERTNGRDSREMKYWQLWLLGLSNSRGDFEGTLRLIDDYRAKKAPDPTARSQYDEVFELEALIGLQRHDEALKVWQELNAANFCDEQPYKNIRTATRALGATALMKSGHEDEAIELADLACQEFQRELDKRTLSPWTLRYYVSISALRADALAPAPDSSIQQRHQELVKDVEAILAPTNKSTDESIDETSDSPNETE